MLIFGCLILSWKQQSVDKDFGVPFLNILLSSLGKRNLTKTIQESVSQDADRTNNLVMRSDGAAKCGFKPTAFGDMNSFGYPVINKGNLET